MRLNQIFKLNSNHNYSGYEKDIYNVYMFFHITVSPFDAQITMQTQLTLTMDCPFLGWKWIEWSVLLLLLLILIHSLQYLQILFNYSFLIR